jgi:hypothetical protein
VSAERLLDHFAMLEGITERTARGGVVEALLRQTNLWEVRTRSSAASPAACGSASASPSRSSATRS